MTLIRPFTGLRPLPEYTQAVIAPPYDVLSSTEARQRAAERPYSFLHISKPEIDLLDNTDLYADAVYAKGLENFQRLIRNNVLKQDVKPNYYLYGLTMGSHQQVGLVAVASVAAYNAHQIRKHELTRPDKEDDRVRHIETLNAQTGPVFLTYKRHAVIDNLVSSLTIVPPFTEATADDGVIHRLWIVDNPEHIQLLTHTFTAIGTLYIADGHHRCAAAARVAASRQSLNPQHHGEENYNYFLAVIFPDNQMQILNYNRVVQDLNGLTVSVFLQKVEENFTVKSSDKAVQPQKSGEFGLFLANHWYCLTIRQHKLPTQDPIKQLDVSILADYLLSPILGIHDPRRDKRIDFVGGIRGLAELEQRVNRGEMAVAFSLYPTRLQELMTIADAGHIMPPKSTWFEPKLADGLVSHIL